MLINMETKGYIFVIDTDSYAGNFERDLCAYITGVVGDCGVGREFTKLYREETNDKHEDGSQFCELLEQRSDKNGCCRPCSIYETKGWLCSGDDRPVKEEKWDQKKANEKYRKSQSRIFQGYYDAANKENIKELKRLQEEIDYCLSEKNVCPRVPPNNSVAIYFYDKPTKDIIELMKKRAFLFSDAAKIIAKKRGYNESSSRVNIIGFRLIQELEDEKEIEI